MNPAARVETDRDSKDLARFGYVQELFRSMGGFSNFAISFSIISILTGAVTLYDYGLEQGGPAEMAFGWPIVSVLTLAVAASMAELSSAFPISGELFHWAIMLGGRGWGWFTAWFNIFGLVATVAGVDYGCAQFLTPLLGLSSDARTVLAVYGVILLSHGLFNHYGIRLVAWLNDFSVTVHILGVVAIIGLLMFFAPKHPAAFFFEARTSTPHTYFWAFLLGLLQAQWTFTGYDASAHVSEETVDPRRRVPWGIVSSVVVSAAVGYLLLFALTLSIHDIPSALGATDVRGNKIPAVIAILRQGLGPAAGSAASGLAGVGVWVFRAFSLPSLSPKPLAFSRRRRPPQASLLAP